MGQATGQDQPIGDAPAPREHFLALDGLRGVAALCVLAFHSRFAADIAWIDHGFLAVDFFFLLSGFVIAYAYEDRLRSGAMPLPAYARLRAIRLLPLIALGALLGTIVLIDAALAQNWLGGVLKALICLPLAILLIPAPPALAPLSFATNEPSWSLFFEVVANAIHALIARFLGMPLLLAIIAVSGLVLGWLILSLGSVAFGWDWSTLPLGLPRVLFPFFLGVLLCRLRMSGRLPALPIPGWLLALILVATVMMPLLPGVWNALYEVAALFVVYPLLVVAGSFAQPSGRWLPLVKRSAELSYPLYILHYPLMKAVQPLLAGLSGIGHVLALSAIIVPVALLAGRYYDEPVRRRLASIAMRPRVRATHLV